MTAILTVRPDAEPLAWATMADMMIATQLKWNVSVVCAAPVISPTA
nr:hypothetical protein [Marinicella sp. W31]MDC2880110.1 hypothetical protein [Marinicella sp. W31]